MFVVYSDGVGRWTLPSGARHRVSHRLLDRLHAATRHRLLSTRRILVSGGNKYTKRPTSVSHHVSTCTIQLVHSSGALTLFIDYNVSQKNRLYVAKIISKRCEFVKLCHISRGGPVFFDTVYTHNINRGLIIVVCSVLIVKSCSSGVAAMAGRSTKIRWSDETVAQNV